MNNSCLTFVYALSPLHAGTGQGAGILDLPIAREKATGLPFLPGSSLKGTLRARGNTTDDASPARYSQQECKQLFGPDTTEVQSETNQASSAQFSDQRLLLLPIRSLAGTFAWVTSPYVLHRFARDIEDVQMTLPEGNIPTIQDEESCAVIGDTSKLIVNTRLYLEDLELTKIQTADYTNTLPWARWIAERVFPNQEHWQEMLQERFCIVHDDVFSFLIDTATEVTARIKMQENSKTVQDGGLWYEEALPAETILSGIVLSTPRASGITPTRTFEILQVLTEKTLQFGGKATVGRGFCRVKLSGNIVKKGK